MKHAPGLLAYLSEQERAELGEKLRPAFRSLVRIAKGGSAKKPTRRTKKATARARDKAARAARKQNRSRR